MVTKHGHMKRHLFGPRNEKHAILYGEKLIFFLEKTIIKSYESYNL